MRYIEKPNIELKKSNYYVAIDFDRTITTLKSEDSWAVTGTMLGEEFNKKMTELYQIYRPVELDYEITFEEKNKAMEKWYQECMDLYYEYHLTEEQLKESVKVSNLIFREGAKKFLETMYRQDVPVIILSAGIGNTIEQFLKESNCYFENMFIISNFIDFDEKGNMKKFDGDIIHTLNKTMCGHLSKELEKKIEGRVYRLLFGDTVEDKKMIEEKEWKQTISVGFLNEKIEKNLSVYQKNFDIVLTGDDATFGVVEKIVF